MKKILIIKLGALGDMIFSEGAICDIKNHHKNDEITLLTSPFFGRLFASYPGIDRIEIDHRRPRWDIIYLFNLIRKLRRHRYDMVYDLQNNSRTNLYHKLLQPIAWCGKASFATHRYTQNSSPDQSRHDYLQAQLQLANIPIDFCKNPNWLWLKQPVAHLLASFNIRHPFILLIPGCSKRHPEKRWPGYNQLAAQLQSLGHIVVCAPGPDEMDLINTFPGICLLDNHKPLSIPQLIGLAQYTSLVIGNDSGPTHLLACCQTKGIALFHNPLYIADSGISRHYSTLQAHPIDQISIQKVLEKVAELLKTKTSNTITTPTT